MPINEVRIFILLEIYLKEFTLVFLNLMNLSS